MLFACPVLLWVLCLNYTHAQLFFNVGISKRCSFILLLKAIIFIAAFVTITNYNYRIRCLDPLLCDVILLDHRFCLPFLLFGLSFLLRVDYIILHSRGRSGVCGSYRYEAHISVFFLFFEKCAVFILNVDVTGNMPIWKIIGFWQLNCWWLNWQS